MFPGYLNSVIKQFEYYKMLGEKAMEQVPDEALFRQYNEESNSIAIIVHHLSGNMRSRWTDFRTADGEKEWRNRESEFEPGLNSRQQVMQSWNEGWACFLDALRSLTDDELAQTIYIRNMGHSILEAVNRQLAHYPYHVGQIIFIAKMASDKAWISLSIPRGASTAYNADKFAQPKRDEHFTDEFVKK